MVTRRMADAPPFTQLRNEMDRVFECFFGDYEAGAGEMGRREDLSAGVGWGYVVIHEQRCGARHRDRARPSAHDLLVFSGKTKPSS